MGAGSEIHPLLRLVLGSAMMPTLQDADPAAAAATGFTGNLTTGPYNLNSYRSMEKTGVVIFEGLGVVRSCAATSQTLDQFARRFVDKTVVRSLHGEQVQMIILTFDFDRHDLKDCEALERAKARRNSIPSPVEAQYHAGGSSRLEMMSYLLKYLMNEAPLRAGLTLIVSGLTHACSAISRTAGQLPICVRLSADGKSREVVAPWEVIGLRPDSGLSLPRDPQHWFRTTYEADDQVRFWMVCMMYYVPPKVAANWNEPSYAEQHRAMSPHMVIVSEDTGIMIECMAVIAQQYGLSAERRGRPGNIYFLRSMVLGYTPKEGETELSGRKGNEVKCGQQINLRLAVRTLCHCFDPLFEGLGLNTPMAFVLLAMLRANDYYTSHVISGTNPYALLRAMASSNKADVLTRGNNRPFTVHHQSLREGVATSMFDPVSIQIDYAKFAAMMAVLTSRARARRPGPASAAEVVLRDAAVRAHASRISLMMFKTMNNHIPGCVCPSATETQRTLQGTLISSYGYTLAPRDPNGVAVPSIVAGAPPPTTICTPLSEMPCEPDNPARCSDSRTMYAVPTPDLSHVFMSS